MKFQNNHEDSSQSDQKHTHTPQTNKQKTHLDSSSVCQPSLVPSPSFLY